MLRACSLLGMTGGFLVISPVLRGNLLDGFTWTVGQLDKYSPYSYVGVALALLVGLMAAFSSTSATR